MGPDQQDCSLQSLLLSAVIAAGCWKEGCSTCITIRCQGPGTLQRRPVRNFRRKTWWGYGPNLQAVTLPWIFLGLAPFLLLILKRGRRPLKNKRGTKAGGKILAGQPSCNDHCSFYAKTHFRGGFGANVFQVLSAKQTTHLQVM